jgi:hypothetical protein
MAIPAVNYLCFYRRSKLLNISLTYSLAFLVVPFGYLCRLKGLAFAGGPWNYLLATRQKISVNKTSCSLQRPSSFRAVLLILSIVALSASF